jgi:hypothetical protein
VTSRSESRKQGHWFGRKSGGSIRSKQTDRRSPLPPPLLDELCTPLAVLIALMTSSRDSIDTAGIASASTYVNNLLLSRGLLRDGKSIHFERLIVPSSSRHHDSKRRKDDPREDRYDRDDGADSGKITTLVLNLIHDLVLSQDVGAGIERSDAHCSPY